VICLLKRIVVSSHEAKKGLWNREANRGNELMGKTVGIIGYGNTGSAFAQKLSGLGVRILAFDKYRKGFSNEFVAETTLSDVLKHADIISFHVPLTNETLHYADRDFFKIAPSLSY
jgi:D-3-phosphoglycerate dehydrogenase / 2-oxoglutarate reductase